MHRTLKLLAACSILLLCGNQPLSSTEARLVGRWRVNGKSASIDLTFRADHLVRMVEQWSGHKHVSHGRWSADGDRLFLAFDDDSAEVREWRKVPTTILWRTADVIVLSRLKDPNETIVHRVK